MRTLRVRALLATFALLAGGEVRAQAHPDAPAPPPTANEKAWSFSAAAFTYLLPDEPDYVQPTLTADHGRLHLEARYNYEGRKAGSAWVGYNLKVGHQVALELTPIVGVVFGDTEGIAPGYKASLSWRKLDLTSESEYVFDTGSSSDSFFYTWSELGWTPLEWLRLGLVVQRTKVYKTELDIQRGFMLGVSYKRASFTTYVFNPDAGSPPVVLAVSLDF